MGGEGQTHSELNSSTKKARDTPLVIDSIINIIYYIQSMVVGTIMITYLVIFYLQ
jgi:hypothetical protein